MAARRPFWKWLRWKSIGFCLWPPSTCIWNLKLKFQSKLDLCSGNHVVYRQTDGQTDRRTDGRTRVKRHLELDPPITIEDIEVTHRLGKPPQTNQDGQEASEDGSRQPPKPRPVIVKLASRRTKNAIMEERKKLKDNPYKCANETTATVYIGDDLTKRRANLAFQARQLRKNKLIYDTWVTNCKIVVKDNYNRISLIQSEEDIKKFKWRSKTINGNLQQP